MLRIARIKTFIGKLNKPESWERENINDLIDGSDDVRNKQRRKQEETYCTLDLAKYYNERIDLAYFETTNKFV